MSTKKPLYIDEATGKTKRISDGEDLPGNEDIESIKKTLCILILKLTEAGFEFEEYEEVQEFLEKNLDTI